MVAMFALLGIANGVYHPADYAILSQLVSAERVGQAFSLHIFAGFLGTAVAPASMLILQHALGWQGAFLAASCSACRGDRAAAAAGRAVYAAAAPGGPAAQPKDDPAGRCSCRRRSCSTCCFS